MLSTKSRGAKNKLRAGIKNSSHIQVVGLRGRLWKHSASGYFLGLGLGLVAGSGAGRKQIFQPLHDIRLVENLFSPGPLSGEAPTHTEEMRGQKEVLHPFP
jgi:hypothetical protein